MLDVLNLNQFYGESHTLWDLEFSIEKGACVSVLGRNGVGKTTLMQCLMGLLDIRSGQIIYRGQDFAKLAAESRASAGIAYVPQGRQIFPLLTVEENIKTGLFAANRAKEKVPEFIYDLFPVLVEMKRRRGGDLSGGQQQQLALARALTLDPSLLILDEPTEGIQPNIVAEIAEVIGKLNHEHSITVLLVEQKLAFARRTASDYLIMDRGRKVASGKISDLGEDLVNQFLTV